MQLVFVFNRDLFCNRTSKFNSVLNLLSLPLHFNWSSLREFELFLLRSSAVVSLTGLDGAWGSVYV